MAVSIHSKLTISSKYAQLFHVEFNFGVLYLNCEFAPLTNDLLTHFLLTKRGGIALELFYTICKDRIYCA